MLVAFEPMVNEGFSAADVQATFCSTLVDEWTRLGVTHAMVAPGSRSTPMALAVARDQRWTTSVFHDERSAAFAALGYALSSGRPAMVLCTSGTAATHFHAAVVEADLAGVPMLVITADRPPESHDVGAAQTIRQNGLFGSAVRWSHDPGVPDQSVATSWRSLARRALGATFGAPAGPVHVNLPFREPLVGTARGLPPSTTSAPFEIARAALGDDHRDRLRRRFDVARPLLVVGRGAPEQLIDVATDRGWPVVAESRMRRSPRVVTHFDSLLRIPEFADTHVPDLVVRVGDAPASKVFGQWLSSHAVPQVHVSCDGRVYDPDHRIETRVVTSADDVVSLFASSNSNRDPVWVEEWLTAERCARDAVREGLDAMAAPSGVGAVSTFVHGLPEDSAVVVSSSMPIRDVEWFAGPLGSRHVVANRGANGIDGVVATAIGVALHRGGPVGVLIGDVALLHDSSSLAGLASRGVDVRVMVVDNDGGGIFHHLPQATSVEPEIFDLLYGTPHGTDFASLGAAHGMTTSVAGDRESVRRAALVAGPTLTIVRTDRDGDVAAHRELHSRIAAAFRADQGRMIADNMA
jgi:2-succinyl-5-enolpyruvyl-6-hydroxy-3-cyclohexene-1-carboxylate synthase